MLSKTGLPISKSIYLQENIFNNKTDNFCLTYDVDFVSLAIVLDYEEIEEYFVCTTDNGKLALSSEVWIVYKDRSFSIVNIFDEEDAC